MRTVETGAIELDELEDCVCKTVVGVEETEDEDSSERELRVSAVDEIELFEVEGGTGSAISKGASGAGV